jgi:hypothetical protein
MSSLIARIEEGDDDLTTLALTSECESSEELDRLLEALETSQHCVQSIAFRESFFLFRRMREHLSRADFFRMLHGVSQYVTDTLQLPPTMLGMVRGQLASLTIGSEVQHYHADESITFGSDADVFAIAERLHECSQLRTLKLGDSYFLRTRPPCLDPILNAVGEHTDTLELLDLSSHPEQRLKQPLITTAGLERLLGEASTSLHTLNLSRLGLSDEHFGFLAQALTTTANTLQWLCIDGNRPSRAGLEVLANALATGLPTLRGISLCETRCSYDVDWSRLFPANEYLQELEMDLEQVTFPYVSTIEHWMTLNQQGRSDWMRDGRDLPAKLWPLVLEPLSDSPDTLWYLLQTFSESLLLSTT